MDKLYTDDQRGRIQGLAKNTIINGNFDIWQRGTSFAAIAGGDYSTDRFIYLKGGTMVHTISQSTDVPTVAQSNLISNYSLKIDCTTADAAVATTDFVLFRQMIEGYNYKYLKDKTCTLSFWVKATKTGVYCIAFGVAAFTRTYLAEYTVNSSDTWEKKEITLTFNQTGGTENYTNGIGLYVDFALVCGSDYQSTPDTWHVGTYLSTANQVNACDNTDNNFFLSQVQLEVGSAATEFEYRDIGQELALCQRYYERFYNTAHIATGVAYTTTSMYWTVAFNTEKRVIPTMVWSDISHFVVIRNGTTSAVNTFTNPYPNVKVGGIETGITPTTAGYAGVLRIVSAVGWLDFDSEL